ncbi:MAG TPA: extracellular solute-binding protein, partial [Rhodopila sp.]|nr:extracellular solute-binding protein [Rhodopila sp.]
MAVTSRATASQQGKRTTMLRRTLIAGTAALASTPLLPARAQAAKTKIVWWHAMTAALGEQVARIADTFNQSQNAVEVQAIYKGGYADLLNETIAASRAGQAPHLAQIFEVGTGTMLAAGKAVKQLWELSKETGVTVDPKTYIPAVRGYYSLSDGRMASAPFNSSTAVMWYSKDAFRKAGLDPDKPPATWEDVVKAAQAIKDKNAAEIPSTSAWFSWIQLEQFSALHNIPFASESDGFDGLGARLEINSKQHVRQIGRLFDMAKEGTFKYTGRDNAPDQLLVSGKAGIHFDSSGMRGDLVKSAK